MKVRRVSKPDELLPILESIDSQQEKVFLLFFGSEDPATQQSWCPDCVIADPRIRKQLLTVPDSVLLECPVGLKGEWRQNEKHFYKTHPELKIERIPTLIRWKSGRSVGKLVEDECLDDSKFHGLLD